MAGWIVAEATGEDAKTPYSEAGKDPAAMARGRKSGVLSGGAAKADFLTPAGRAKIASRDAQAR